MISSDTIDNSIYLFIALIALNLLAFIPLLRLSSLRCRKVFSKLSEYVILILALKVGVHPNVLGRYERNLDVPSVEVAAKIAKALGVSLDYLSEITDVEQDRVVLNRIQDIASLPNEDRNQVFKVIDALIRDYKASNK
jgi:transcriptional regulator with XRE-family HTH domain